MRRALAAMLMLVFSFPLIAPALASAPDDSSLPACCRRDGKHHCAMGLSLAAVPPRFVVVSEKCPFPLIAHLALMLPHAFSPRHPGQVAIPASAPSALIRQAEAGYRISRDRARSKRGPPQAQLLAAA